MATTKKGSYDYIIKTLIIGDSGVGKTCVLLRYCDNQFSFSHVSTVGLDFKSKLVEIDGKGFNSKSGTLLDRTALKLSHRRTTKALKELSLRILAMIEAPLLMLRIG